MLETVLGVTGLDSGSQKYRARIDTKKFNIEGCGTDVWAASQKNRETGLGLTGLDICTSKVSAPQ